MPRTYIISQHGQKATAHKIVEFFAQMVTRTNRLTGGVAFVDATAKKPSGKIFRKQLQEKAAGEYGVRVRVRVRVRLRL